MASEHHDWNVPAPLRALLWWPAVALVVAMINPSAAPWTIAAAGAVLAVLGVVGSMVGAVIARRLADSPAEQAEAAPASLAMAGAEVAQAGLEQHAA
jgi:membrane protein implicated in regulation of membrane protease activity